MLCYYVLFKRQSFVKEVINGFDTYSICSGLKPNKYKYEIAGIDVLKWVSMELSGMECIDLAKHQ